MKIKSFATIAIAAILLQACGTDFKKTPSGIPYKIFSDGKGPLIVKGDIVKFQRIEKIRDTTLLSTYNQMPQYQPVDSAANSYDIMNAILYMLPQARKGDSIYFTMSMDSFIKKDPTILQRMTFIKRGDQLITTIKIVDVFKSEKDVQADFNKEGAATSKKMEEQDLAAFNKNPKMQEQKKKDDQIIGDYLAKNNIKTEKTPWGDYIQVLQPGNGTKPTFGKFVSLRYTGMDLNGKVFDTNTTPGKDLYTISVGQGGSILGFEDAVKQMSKGEKARVFIPSVIAYGERGNPPVIQPNENIIFDLEVVDISDTPPQQKPMQQPTDTTKHQ